MKMQILTATVLATLVARAALAASEGGDTWSTVEPHQRSINSLVQSAPGVQLSEQQLGRAFEGSEGGDTWSTVQALGDTSVQPASVQNRHGGTDAEYVGAIGGSEGGDTWSRFVPQFESQPQNIASASSGVAKAR